MRTDRLLVKIYLGFVLSLVLLISLFTLIASSYQSTHEKERALIAELLIQELAQKLRDPAALQAAVARLSAYPRYHVSLYDPEGRLIAATAPPPHPRLSADKLAKLSASERVQSIDSAFVRAIKEDGRLVAIGIMSETQELLATFALLGSTLVVLMLIAMILARHMVIPLQRIASATRQFGRGDLSVRAGIKRNDEIGEVGRAFDEMADCVTHLMTAQQELMANVSHELQTPISRIHVAVELMQEGIMDQATELLPEITHDLGELERLIEDVMTVARLNLSRSHGHIVGPPLRLERIQVAELLEKAASRFRSRYQTHELVVDISAELPSIFADTVLLRRCIENLLENARKYSDPGSTIHASASASPTGVNITIRDHGIGMDAADLKQIFTPFFRTDRSRSRATGGVGLGLALTRRVVEAHNGTIGLHSAPGQGTTVTLDLPCESESGPGRDEPRVSAAGSRNEHAPPPESASS
jgi:signal transduction histidine kinase